MSTLWALNGHLKFDKEKNVLIAPMHTCTFDSELHRPQSQDVELTIENVVEFVSELRFPDPVFQRSPNIPIKPYHSLQRFERFVGSDTAVSTENVTALIEFLMFNLLTLHDVLKRRTYLNYRANTQELEYRIITVMDKLRFLEVRLDSEWLRNMHEDIYGIITDKNKDQYVILDFLGNTRHIDIGLTHTDHVVGERIRANYHNPEGFASPLSVEHLQTVEFSQIPHWVITTI